MLQPCNGRLDFHSLPSRVSDPEPQLVIEPTAMGEKTGLEINYLQNNIHRILLVNWKQKYSLTAVEKIKIMASLGAMTSQDDHYFATQTITLPVILTRHICISIRDQKMFTLVIMFQGDKHLFWHYVFGH